nr:uncharacterized protein LOC109159167 [Ipomoea trifida]
MSDSDNHNVSGRDYDEGDEAGTKVPPLRREAPPSTKSTKWSTFQPTPRRTKVRYRPQPLLRMSTQRVEANLCGWWSRHCFRILAPVPWRTWLHRYAEGERLGNYAPQGELQALRPHPELKPSRLRAKQVRHAEPPPTIGVACTCRGQLVSSRALRNRTGGRRTFHHSEENAVSEQRGHRAAKVFPKRTRALSDAAAKISSEVYDYLIFRTPEGYKKANLEPPDYGRSEKYEPVPIATPTAKGSSTEASQDMAPDKAFIAPAAAPRPKTMVALGAKKAAAKPAADPLVVNVFALARTDTSLGGITAPDLPVTHGQSRRGKEKRQEPEVEEELEEELATAEGRAEKAEKELTEAESRAEKVEQAEKEAIDKMKDASSLARFICTDEAVAKEFLSAFKNTEVKTPHGRQTNTIGHLTPEMGTLLPWASKAIRSAGQRNRVPYSQDGHLAPIGLEGHKANAIGYLTPKIGTLLPSASKAIRSADLHNRAPYSRDGHLAPIGREGLKPGNGISPSSCFSCANVTVAAQHEPSSSAYALPPQRATANPGEISLLLASMEAEPRGRMSYAIDDGGVQQLPLTAFSFSSDVATVSDGGLSFPLLSATSPSPATEATAQLGGSPSSPGNGISPSSCFSCANVTVAAQHEPSSSAYALPPQRATANPGEISLLLASMEAEPRGRMSYAIDDGGVQQLPLTAFSFSSDVATVSDGGLSFPLLSATSPSPATEATAQLGGSPSSVRW